MHNLGWDSSLCKLHLNCMHSIRVNKVIIIFANSILGRDSIDSIFCSNTLIGLNADVIIWACKFIVSLASNNIGINIDVNTDVIDEFHVVDSDEVTNNYISNSDRARNDCISYSTDSVSACNLACFLNGL